MRIYISGDLSCSLKFHQAEAYLLQQKHTPVNPFKTDCNKLGSWSKRLEIISGCDAIYLLANWINSKESIAEKYYCLALGKQIMFESCIEEENRLSNEEELITSRIKGAIEEVTGLTFAQYTEDDRKTEGFFCRMIFSIHCLKAGISDNRIIHDTGRSYYSIRYYLKKYDSEYQFNKEFRDWAGKVNQMLNPDLVKLIVQPPVIN